MSAGRALLISRMIVGGAESAVLEELRANPHSRLVISHEAGPAAALAAQLRAVTVLPAPGLAALLEALRGADVVHLQTLNNNPLLHLAAALSGARRVIETHHNRIEPLLEGFVDGSLLVSEAQRPFLSLPQGALCLPSPVSAPAEAPKRPPRAGRPLRLLEVRRPGKQLRFTVEDLLVTGLLDDLPLELRVAGIDEAPADPRVHHLGPVDDLAPHYAWADALVHGTATESFGRVLYEALGTALPVITTPVDALPIDLAWAPIAWIHPTDPAACARALRAALLAPPPADALSAARQRVRAHFDPPVIEARRAAWIAALPRRRRWAEPGDVPAALLPAFCAAADALFERRDPGALAALTALPPAPQALLTALLAHLGVLPPPQRTPTLMGALRLLGPRPGLLVAAARALTADGRPAEATRLQQAAWRLP